MSSSLDPWTLATPTERVVLSRGLGSLGTIRVLADALDPPPASGAEDAAERPRGGLPRLVWEPVEQAGDDGQTGAGAGTGDDPEDVHVLLLGPAATTTARTETLASARPWVVVVRSDRPDADDWERELADAKYALAVFDGRSQYFVSPDHDELPTAFAAGDAAAWDGLVAEVIRWRTAALGRWALATGTEPGRASRAERELHAIRQTVSWRVTAPLRKVRSRMRP